jgi:hypothetical protein
VHHRNSVSNVVLPCCALHGSFTQTSRAGSKPSRLQTKERQERPVCSGILIVPDSILIVVLQSNGEEEAGNQPLKDNKVREDVA